MERGSIQPTCTCENCHWHTLCVQLEERCNVAEAANHALSESNRKAIQKYINLYQQHTFRVAELETQLQLHGDETTAREALMGMRSMATRLDVKEEECLSLRKDLANAKGAMSSLVEQVEMLQGALERVTTRCEALAEDNASPMHQYRKRALRAEEHELMARTSSTPQRGVSPASETPIVRSMAAMPATDSFNHEGEKSTYYRSSSDSESVKPMRDAVEILAGLRIEHSAPRRAPPHFASPSVTSHHTSPPPAVASATTEERLVGNVNATTAETSMSHGHADHASTVPDAYSSTRRNELKEVIDRLNEVDRRNATLQQELENAKRREEENEAVRRVQEREFVGEWKTKAAEMAKMANYWRDIAMTARAGVTPSGLGTPATIGGRHADHTALLDVTEQSPAGAPVTPVPRLEDQQARQVPPPAEVPSVAPPPPPPPPPQSSDESSEGSGDDMEPPSTTQSTSGAAQQGAVTPPRQLPSRTVYGGDTAQGLQRPIPAGPMPPGPAAPNFEEHSPDAAPRAVPERPLVSEPRPSLMPASMTDIPFVTGATFNAPHQPSAAPVTSSTAHERQSPIETEPLPTTTQQPSSGAADSENVPATPPTAVPPQKLMLKKVPAAEGGATAPSPAAPKKLLLKKAPSGDAPKKLLLKKAPQPASDSADGATPPPAPAPKKLMLKKLPMPGGSATAPAPAAPKKLMLKKVPVPQAE